MDSIFPVDQNFLGLPFLEKLDGFFQFYSEIVIAYRLHNEINGVDGIALHCIFCHSGDKDDSNSFILGSDFSGNLQAVASRHFDIQKNNVVVAVIFFQKFKAGVVHVHFDLHVVLPLELLQIIRQPLGVLGEIIHDCYS